MTVFPQMMMPGGVAGGAPPIQFVGSGASTGATTITIPTHQTGDIIVIAAFRETAETVPDLPAGYTSLATTSTAGLTMSSRVGYKVATSASETSGTWTNANALGVAVYRDVRVTGSIWAEDTTDSSNAIIYGITGNEYTLDSALSWVVAFVCVQEGGITGSDLVPTSLTLRSSANNNRTIVVSDTTDAYGSTSWTNRTIIGAVIGETLSDSATIMVELKV